MRKPPEEPWTYMLRSVHLPVISSYFCHYHNPVFLQLRQFSLRARDNKTGFIRKASPSHQPSFCAVSKEQECTDQRVTFLFNPGLTSAETASRLAGTDDAHVRVCDLNKKAAKQDCTFITGTVGVRLIYVVNVASLTSHVAQGVSMDTGR